MVQRNKSFSKIAKVAKKGAQNEYRNENGVKKILT